MKHIINRSQDSLKIEMPLIKLLCLYLEKLEKLTNEERAIIICILKKPPVTLVHMYPPTVKQKRRGAK